MVENSFIVRERRRGKDGISTRVVMKRLLYFEVAHVRRVK
jgi:hypothetical protein